MDRHEVKIMASHIVNNMYMGTKAVYISKLRIYLIDYPLGHGIGAYTESDIVDMFNEEYDEEDRESVLNDDSKLCLIEEVF